MSEQISGRITLDTYLVFDKAKVTNENSRLTNKLIGFDTYVYEFHRDLYSTSDSYAEAVCSLDKYIDAWSDWMVDIETHDSSNSVDDIALLIKNAIERAIDGSEIGVKYKVLY